MNTKSFVSFAAALLLSSSIHANPVSADEGKIIFTVQCAACHNVNMRVVGPALANVDQRHNLNWIISFVQSSQTMVKNNDKDAVALFNEFNQTIMPDHADLSGDQVKSILEYIKSQTKTAATDEAPFAKPGRLLPNYTPLAITNYVFFGTYITLVIIMIACFVIAVRVKEIEREKR